MQPDPKVGFVSLGCPKALVDSEQILSRLKVEGYQIAPDYSGADLVIVNTCGFIDDAVAESLDAIGEALSENGKVIVTGCLGVKEAEIRARFPQVLEVTGPHRYQEVVNAVHNHLPPKHDPFVDLLPPQGVKLTPPHYAYLKISEGCNHRCTFCIIPSLRGDLVSRPIDQVMAEAERLVHAGVKELLVISQDTSAYGQDIRYQPRQWRGESRRSHISDLANALGELGIWIRLHYVYPYPHVDELIPLMAGERVLPYLDVPFQHASPRVLRAMKRPAAAEKNLERINAWRKICPELTIRSTFIVGFPGETELEFESLLEFLREAKLDRVGCFKYSPVDGARANELAAPVDEDTTADRYDEFMRVQAAISTERLAAKVGRRLRVLVDHVDENGAVARSQADAPEIDGVVTIADGNGLGPGDWADVVVESASEYDLHARLALD